MHIGQYSDQIHSEVLSNLCIEVGIRPQDYQWEIIETEEQDYDHCGYWYRSVGLNSSPKKITLPPTLH